MNDELDADPTNDDRDGGFGIVPRTLRGRLTAYEIAVYVALTWRIDEHGECFMRHQRLADEAGMGVTSAKKALETLRDKGFVSWRPKMGEHGGVLCNVYRLNMTTDPQPPGGEGVVATRPGGSRLAATEREPMNETPGTPPVVPPKRAHRMPDGYEPKDSHRDLARRLRVHLEAEFAQFCDHHVARGSTFKSWDAALNTWIRNAAKWSQGRGRGPSPADSYERDGQAVVMTGAEWADGGGRG